MKGLVKKKKKVEERKDRKREREREREREKQQKQQQATGTRGRKREVCERFRAKRQDEQNPQAMVVKGLRSFLLFCALLCAVGPVERTLAVREPRGAASRKYFSSRERERRERKALVESFFATPEKLEGNGSWAWPHGMLGPQFNPNKHDWEQAFAHVKRESGERQSERRKREVESSARGEIEDAAAKNETGKEWFGFIPSYLGTLKPDSIKGQMHEGHCYKHVGFEVDFQEEIGTELHLLFYLEEHESGKIIDPCVETLVLFSGNGFKMLNFAFGGMHKVTWDTVELTADEKWYLYNRGLHVFLFRKGSWVSIVEDVYHTMSLFVPFETQDVNRFSAMDNLDFLSRYQQIQPFMTPRTPEQQSKPLDLDPALIQSGDFMGIVRLDGVDTMMAWATGATTGHTAVAMRKPVIGDKPGDLYICESTAKDAYWDTNGIQCTPYHEWIDKAFKAEHNVVWAPLAPSYRKDFNAVQAWEWFETVEGLDYGYQNMIFSWIDTLEENYPCIPPKYDRCLSWVLLEVLSIFYDRISTEVAQKIWLQALNKRVGTEGLTTLELYKEYLSRKPKDVDATKYLSSLVTIPEKDEWKYTMFPNTTQTGESMVCSVFVCRVWKAAGLFKEIGNNVNCGEFTPYDVYKLKIFDDDYHFPDECEVGTSEDHASQVCQIMGKYTLHLNDYNTVEMHNHMSETCPSFPPKYIRDNTKC